MCQYLHFRRINVTSTIGGVVHWRILHQHKPQIHLLPSYELTYPIHRRFWVRSHQDMIGIGKGIHLFGWIQKDKRLISESTSKDPEQSFSIDSLVGCLWNISPHRPSYGNPFNSFFLDAQKTSCSRNASTISTEVNTCGPHKANFQFHNWSVATKKPSNKKKHGKKFGSPFHHHQALTHPSKKNPKNFHGNSHTSVFFSLTKPWDSWEFMKPGWFPGWFACHQKKTNGKPPLQSSFSSSSFPKANFEASKLELRGLWRFVRRTFHPFPGVWDSRPRLRETRVFHYKPSILGYPYFWKHP